MKRSATRRITAAPRAATGRATSLLIAGSMVALLAGCTRGEVQHRLGTVEKKNVVQRVTASGMVTPVRKTLIGPPYNGYIHKIFVKVGDSVRTGDPIVTVTQAAQPAGDGLYPLRAPFDGVVSQVLRSVGEYVDQGSKSTIVRIDDTSKLLVESMVPEIEVAKLKAGQEVLVKVSAVLDRSYKGKVRFVSLSAKEQQDWERSRVEFNVLVDIVNPDEKIRPGMSAVLDVVTAEAKDVLTVEHEFVDRTREGDFVTTADGKRIAVKLGVQNEERVEIVSGVNEGMKVRQIDYSAVGG